MNEQTDGHYTQTTVILQDPSQDEGPIIKVTLSFCEFIPIHPKPDDYTTYFMR